VAAAALTVLAVPALPALADSVVPESVVRRTTLIVGNIESSIEFYRDVIGMELWLDLPGTVGDQSLPSEAPPGAPSRFVIMKGRDPWIGMIGLLQYGESETPAGPPAALVPGDAVLMMETADLDGIWARMQKSGTSIFRAPKASQVTGADGRRWSARFLFAFDPDGRMLEINEPEWLARVPAEN
jgi:catechol 2,3-dioxygenase-like lactoylglutathione lyase family enzyme